VAELGREVSLRPRAGLGGSPTAVARGPVLGSAGLDTAVPRLRTRCGSVPPPQAPPPWHELFLERFHSTSRTREEGERGSGGTERRAQRWRASAERARGRGGAQGMGQGQPWREPPPVADPGFETVLAKKFKAQYHII